MATIRERSRGSGGNSGHGDSGGLNDIVQPAGLSGHADIAASSATATATAMAAPARQLPAADPAAMPLNAAAAPSEGVPLRESKDKVGQVAHDVWHCTPLGKTRVLRGPHPVDKRCPRSCVVGPEWGFMIFFHSIIILPNLACIIWLYPQLHIIIATVGWACFAFTMTTYSLAVWSDPGYVRRGPKPVDPYFRPVGNYCRICYISRRPGTIHCFDCDACVEELDHHCSFIGKCVGKYTIHYYWWFIAAIIGNMVFSIASVFWWIVLVSQRRHMRMPGSYGSLI